MHEQELSEDSNARLFEKLSQGCFIEYNNAYLYEYMKLSEKVQTLQKLWRCQLTTKIYLEILRRKRGHNYAKKQIRVMGLVPIILENHREQVCEVSIHSLQ
jgi:hypothetical protein